MVACGAFEIDGVFARQRRARRHARPRRGAPRGAARRQARRRAPSSGPARTRRPSTSRTLQAAGTADRGRGPARRRRRRARARRPAVHDRGEIDGGARQEARQGRERALHGRHREDRVRPARVGSGSSTPQGEPAAPGLRHARARGRRRCSAPAPVAEAVAARARSARAAARGEGAELPELGQKARAAAATTATSASARTSRSRTSQRRRPRASPRPSCSSATRRSRWARARAACATARCARSPSASRPEPSAHLGATTTARPPARTGDARRGHRRRRTRTSSGAPRCTTCTSGCGATFLWAGPVEARRATTARSSGEYRAVREGVGIIDVGTLGKFRVSGPDVVAFLERLYPNHVGDIQPGRLRYGLLLDEHGVIHDDGTICRIDDETLLPHGHDLGRRGGRGADDRLARHLGHDGAHRQPDLRARRDQHRRARRRARCSRR